MVGEGARLRRSRSAVQLLDGVTGRQPAEVARRLLGVQAQDLAWARLAFRARGVARAAEVDRALSDGSLVLGWLMRGTLHLVAREDYGRLLALTAPARLTGNLRRLRQEGVSPEDAGRALGIIRAAVQGDGPLTREELAERIGAAGIRTAGQATPHLLFYAALRGHLVAGPLRHGRIAYADAPTWLDPATHPQADESRHPRAAGASHARASEARLPKDDDGLRPLAGGERREALEWLARRYLAGHGPASEADLAAWSGLALRDARTGLAAIASETVGEPGGLIRLAEVPTERDEPPARLLPAFDPYLLGWRDRGFAVPAAHAGRVHPGGGILRAVATSGGTAIATWAIRRTGTGPPRITIDPFEPLPPDSAAALEAETTAVQHFESRP